MKGKRNFLRVSHAQSVYDNKEIDSVVKVLKERRSIMGPETQEFEERVAKLFGKKYGIMVNSGSSANLLAVELMNLPEGSEVITPLLTFSTTIAPLIQKKLVPVFIDVKRGTYVIDEDKVEAAISKKTKALMIPIMFGLLPDMEKLAKIAKSHNIFFIEDSCDAIVSLYKGRPTGVYSDITTTSFYGSHVITAAGGGGMLMVDREDFRDRAKMLRGWGRSSAIFAESEKIKDRFSRKLDNIPYDGKFIFDDVGYNLLPLEISAAFGNVQLDKLKEFVRIRERNYKYLVKLFQKYSDYFILPVVYKNAHPQWQIFPLTIKKGAPFSRLQLVTYLEKENVQTRPLATGNILRQPGFKNIPHRLIKKEYPLTDEVMERGFMIGVHQGLTMDHLNRLAEVVDNFIFLWR